ncbi:MAG: hypothetical protein IE927_09420 [Rhodobacterales bacterium]|nr:hypothetical protein [Rhodobacterales bacterium]
MMHWSTRHVGTPWVAGETDCWHFAASVWRDRWGWQVDPVAVDPADPRAIRQALGQIDPAVWRPVTRLAEGDAALMARGQRPCHVGSWILLPEGPAILHSVERAGVIVTAPDRLREIGYRLVASYRWAACAR